MTISVPDQLTYSYNGNGATKTFAYPKRFIEAAELVVVLEDSDGDQAIQVLNNHYTVTGANDPSGGSVFMLSAPVSGQVLHIYRDTARKQIVDLVDGQQNPAQSTEDQLDRTIMAAQDMKEAFTRAVKSKVGSTGPEFPEPESDKLIGWNNAATGLENKDYATLIPGTVQVLDEDDFASNSDTAVPTQQSTKAYVDNRVATTAGYPQTIYIACGGQSNAIGSDGGSSVDWITEAGFVEVWNPATVAWVDAVNMQGVAPFNADGSNNGFVHAALAVAKATGSLVRLTFAAEGATELFEWTGGGYNNGVVISPADRTVSASNRVQFKKWTDAITAASIVQFDALFWWQGEADFDTPEASYMSELLFLRDDLKARGGSPDADRRFPMVIFGIYDGDYKRSQQARRASTLQRLARRYPDIIGYVSTGDLAGVDGHPTVVNHFTSESYTLAGERGGPAFRDVWEGRGFLEDRRVNYVTIPPEGVEGMKLGYRSYQMADIVDHRLLLVRLGEMRGQTYRIDCSAGPVSPINLNLDYNANSGLDDGGLHFEFYMLNVTDVVNIQSDDGAGTTRNVKLFGRNTAAATTVQLSGRGRGRVVYQGSRYVVYWFPENTPVRTPTTLAADVGFNHTQTFDHEVIRHTQSLTADRTGNLLATNAIAGNLVTVSRTGGGAFNLNVTNQSTATLLKALATNTWCTCMFTGTVWVLIAYGAL